MPLFKFAPIHYTCFAHSDSNLNIINWSDQRCSTHASDLYTILKVGSHSERMLFWSCGQSTWKPVKMLVCCNLTATRNLRQKNLWKSSRNLTKTVRITSPIFNAFSNNIEIILRFPLVYREWLHRSRRAEPVFGNSTPRDRQRGNKSLCAIKILKCYNKPGIFPFSSACM